MADEDPLIRALREAVEEQKELEKLLVPIKIHALRGDLNHLIQPLIGTLRLLEAGRDPAHFNQYLSHYIERLRLVLALMDEAVTGKHVDPELRGRHGVGENHYHE